MVTVLAMELHTHDLVDATLAQEKALATLMEKVRLTGAAQERRKIAKMLRDAGDVCPLMLRSGIISLASAVEQGAYPDAVIEVWNYDSRGA